MIAYNKEWLDNSSMQEELENAFSEDLVSKMEYDNAVALYPVGFYTPNIFIRIGLFILTLIIVGFSCSLFALLFISGSNEQIFGILCILFAATAYITLEWMIREKNHYQSGVDDALLWMSGILFVSGINLLGDVSSLYNAALVFILSFCFCIRFADRLMAVVVIISLLSVVFFITSRIGENTEAVMPFVLMLMSAIIYFIRKKSVGKPEYKYYRQCLSIIEITALLCFYCAGNYFVVREAGISFLHLQLQPLEAIPFAWLFWIFTCAIPFLYILRGIQTKDIILIRVGVILIAAIVFTIRYYYAVMPIETAMLAGGILLLLISYSLSKILEKPIRGFTSQPVVNSNAPGLANIEAIIIAETLSSSNQGQSDGSHFGGGSFGGGGAGSDY